MRCILFLFMLVFTQISKAQIYSPQGEEFSFRVQAYFDSEEGSDLETWEEQAKQQLSHTFGIFQTPHMVYSYDLDYDFVGGIGALQLPIKINIKEYSELEDGKTRVWYTAAGKILLHNNVVKKIKKTMTLNLPLPISVDNYYDADCTDPHYDSMGDFWYFYDPYRMGCEYLRESPQSEMFSFQLKPASQRKLDLDLRLDLLRGNNDNGSLFRIDVIHGFEESSRNLDDLGRKAYEEFHEILLKKGFEREILKGYFDRPLERYTKSIKLADGKTIDVEINSLLVETTITARNVTFAKFFRDSVAEADVIYYAGHSGLGGNLDIPSLEEKAGGFEFNSNKRQIYFFDSCSSYSYYLDSFRAEKTRAKIDVVTNGLASLFDTGTDMLMGFLNEILDPRVEDKTWPEVIEKLEQEIGNRSYLTNVGGI